MQIYTFFWFAIWFKGFFCIEVFKQKCLVTKCDEMPRYTLPVMMVV